MKRLVAGLAVIALAGIALSTASASRNANSRALPPHVLEDKSLREASSLGQAAARTSQARGRHLSGAERRLPEDACSRPRPAAPSSRSP